MFTDLHKLTQIWWIRVMALDAAKSGCSFQTHEEHKRQDDVPTILRRIDERRSSKAAPLADSVRLS